MKKLIFFILTFTSAITTRAQSNWQQQINYTIDVTLNDAERSLDGFIKIQYSNHSPDTLKFIWIHCWPNAYKNDQTAFSEQLLGNGRTDFYFSDRQQRGYINRLDFRADDQEARMEDHPQYIDIIKVILPNPLPPGGQVTLSTPFHVKLPYNFSRSGYVALPTSNPNNSYTDNSYNIAQWYPKPAVYDNKGWHPIPYLDQGEFYSEFASFDVRITVPQSFTIAATGELQNSPSLQEIAPAIAVTHPSPIKPPHPKPGGHHPIQHPPSPSHTVSRAPAKRSPQKRSAPAPVAQNIPTKTLVYHQNNIHDFAFFASKHFSTLHDTLQLPSGRIIQVYSYSTPTANPAWQNSLNYIKDAIRFRSSLVGEYPFNVVTAVETKMGPGIGGMEYPTITAIASDVTDPKALDITIEHEVGHNWFYGILGTNERQYAWMDEGINTYYDNRYKAYKYPTTTPDNWLFKKFPADGQQWSLDILEATRNDQPISTTSGTFTQTGYYLAVYAKTGEWLKKIEDSLGTTTFDSCMHEYYRRWSFKHPYPDDLQKVFDETSHHNTAPLFAQLDQKGPLHPPVRKQLKPTFLFNFRNTDKFNYINILPAFAYNKYDQFMVGAAIHNYDLPPTPFQFFLVPLYATGSHQLNGTGGLNYTWRPDRSFRKIDLGITGERFSTISGLDSNGHQLTGGYYKLAPTLRLTFPNKEARSTQEKFIEWKTYLIGEKELDHYVQKSTDSSYYPVPGKYNFRYLNQLSLGFRDDRALYPYNALLQVQQAASFYRINFTGNYFFNYVKGGGLDMRLFGAKFGYIGGQSATEDLTRFEPKLTAVRGDEDYTYENYFIGRSEFTGFASQQIMMRDGNLKLRTDLFQGLQGRSDNWVAAVNLSSTLPRQIVPEWIPLKVFFDFGTYSGAWQTDPPTSHFLYVGGLQLSLLKQVVNIYIPLVYSKDFSNQLKTVPDQNTFGKKISFSVDLQNIKFRKLFSNIPL
ncbi:MAG TPA: M1 family metallopeptidase [Puia sp.]|nr:M1 family metallopeptidase [Puia sp.]